jgi:hypothetical protein
MKKVRVSRGLAVAAWVSVLSLGFAAAAQADTVQVNIKSILNARSVSTFSNGKIYTWTRGIDGNGYGDGYVTHSVAVHLNYTAGPTLPDSALFTANANHPTMLLNYSNSDSTGFQTHYLSGSDSVTFSVPQGNYSTVYLALTSSEGSTTIGVVLNYSDGPVTSTFTLPDYDQGLTSGVFHVDSNMQKWNNQNSPGDNFGHALDGFGVTTNSAKILTSVKLVKNTAGSYLVLWGVTGVGTVSTAVEQPAAGRAAFEKTRSQVVHAINCGDGKIRFENIAANSELTVFSLSGAKAAHLVCERGGNLVWNDSRNVPPGVYVFEIRSGAEIQRMQVMVGR